MLALVTGVFGHMLLIYPIALRYKGNLYIPAAEIDYSLMSLLEANSSNFPCKGYQSGLGSELGILVVT